jgi:hypothetical protein
MMMLSRRGVAVGALALVGCFAADGVWGQNASQAAAAWPHSIREGDADIVVYQPQAISWPDHETLTARMAVAITRAGQKTPVLGTIDVSMATHTDAAAGTVTLSDYRLAESRFPSLDTSQAAQLQEKIKPALARLESRQVPLQSILLSLKENPAAQPVAVNNNPPAIFYSEHPASLVVFDGEPVLAPAGQTGLSFAVNTNWDVFSDGKSWYLLNNGLWLSAPDFHGPYKPVASLPPAFQHLPADSNFAEVRKAIPPKHKPAGATPAVFVSTQPAEIIVTSGPPKFAPVPSTGLQVVTNTGSTLYFDPTAGRFYFLVSGRWFSAGGLDGPWTFATNDLPPDFALIPPEAKNQAILASVPGTAQAQQAILEAQIPHQATLSKSTAKLTVVYSGPPQFKPVPGTSLMYAVNTSYQVIETGGRYYACYQGAWFVAPAPNGPWVLAGSVPEVIYTIPPSSPLYPVTYVKVYAATPASVTYGYTAGYMMGFITAGVLVYGTGYYYPPVVVPGPVPVFYPYPYSYAGNVWYNTSTGGWARGGTVYGPYGAASGGRYYNPATGGWAQGAAVYGPYGGAGAWSAYNPNTGRYSRGSAAWGPNGATGNASFYNPSTGISGSTVQNTNAYGRWGSSVISGPNQTVNTQSRSNAQGSAGGFQSTSGAEGAGYHTATGNRGGAVKTSGGDVYAGRDGNVYQHSDSGWSKWNDGSWQSVQPPSTSRTQATQATQTNRRSLDSSSYQQLEQDRQARTAGQFQRGAWGSGEGWRSGGEGWRGGEGGRFRR